MKITLSVLSLLCAYATCVPLSDDVKGGTNVKRPLYAVDKPQFSYPGVEYGRQRPGPLLISQSVKGTTRSPIHHYYTSQSKSAPVHEQYGAPQTKSGDVIFDQEGIAHNVVPQTIPGGDHQGIVQDGGPQRKPELTVSYCFPQGLPLPSNARYAADCSRLHKESYEQFYKKLFNGLLNIFFKSYTNVGQYDSLSQQHFSTEDVGSIDPKDIGRVLELEGLLESDEIGQTQELLGSDDIGRILELLGSDEVSRIQEVKGAVDIGQRQELIDFEDSSQTEEHIVPIGQIQEAKEDIGQSQERIDSEEERIQEVTEAVDISQTKEHMDPIGQNQENINSENIGQSQEPIDADNFFDGKKWWDKEGLEAANKKKREDERNN